MSLMLTEYVMFSHFPKVALACYRVPGRPYRACTLIPFSRPHVCFPLASVYP